MEPHSLLIWLVIGGVAGWLAGLVMSGGGFGIIGDIVVGILGSIISGWLFGAYFAPLGGGVAGAIIASAVGAIILLFALRVIRRAV
jgi:uncharacterized membrane protein YeaQ/YmgE (transglycosylase-associated protein family)